MKTTIYNTTTSEAGAIRQEPYTVDGKPGILPDHLVELPVIETERPIITETQKLKNSWVADLENMEYRQEWQIIEKTKEEMTPYVITKAQGLIQLETMGLYDQLMTALDSMSKIDRIVFEATKEWERDNGLVDKMANLFGFDEDGKLDFFINAGKIIV